MNKEQTIKFCRANSMRRTSVLGWAQLNAPLAYQEYIDTANKNLGILHHLHQVGTTVRKSYNSDPERLKKLFAQREKVLTTLNR